MLSMEAEVASREPIIGRVISSGNAAGGSVKSQ